jgi:hypothetical protein
MTYMRTLCKGIWKMPATSSESSSRCLLAGQRPPDENMEEGATRDPRDQSRHAPFLRYFFTETAAWCDAHDARHTLARPNAVGNGGADAVVTPKIRC